MNIGNVQAMRFDGSGIRPATESLTEEGPLSIKVNGTDFTVTMRTPGHDRELARGLMFTEGLLAADATGIDLVERKAAGNDATFCIDVRVDASMLLADFENRRSLLATSSCGLCGRKDLADLEDMPPPVGGSELRMDAALAANMMAAMRAHQETFDRSGGSHAAGLFSESGNVLVVREDIGRHNAVDKAIGWMLANGALGSATAMTVSGRVSFEIVLKAWRARLPFLLAVSAPSTLAVKTAEAAGITLMGFCRDGRATVYSHAGRVVAPAAAESGA